MEPLAPAVSRGSYWIEVYGCQMNVNDAEMIRGILDGAGYSEASGATGADVILIVTCAVRERAETRALGRATHLAGIRRHGRKPTIVLCGCVAQERGEDLLRSIPGIEFVVGPDGYRSLPALLEGSGRGAELSLGTEDYEGVRAVRKAFPRAFVSIMRGCDNYCSYCIVPYVRGRERSRDAKAVLDEIRRLSEAGFREITLLGQNVNSFSSGSVDFPELLARASETAGPAWIRFVTSHPRDLSAALVYAMSSCSNVCRQVHLPVQSGSDAVLGRMNRRYDRAMFLEKIGMLRHSLPGVVMSTDMIAGFPGETEADFLASLSLLEEVRFDYAFLFRYSERKGTAAASFGDAVPVAERLRRLQRLQEAQNRITLEKSKALEGRELPVLMTGEAERPGQQAARTPGNRVAILNGTSFEPGRFIVARILSADGWTHVAEPVREALPGELFAATEAAVGP
jgi:tRNA-2-methylthio-N6-dimethylallyladenosine synthase